jgi:hypothetical protein
MSIQASPPEDPAGIRSEHHRQPRASSGLSLVNSNRPAMTVKRAIGEDLMTVKAVQRDAVSR